MPKKQLYDVSPTDAELDAFDDLICGNKMNTWCGLDLYENEQPYGRRYVLYDRDNYNKELDLADVVIEVVDAEDDIDHYLDPHQIDLLNELVLKCRVAISKRKKKQINDN